MIEYLPASAAVAISAASLIYTIVAARSKAATERVRSLELRVDGIEDRATKLEADLRHLPDKDAAHRLEMSVAKLEAKIDVIAERMKPVAAISERLQEMMMERAGR